MYCSSNGDFVGFLEGKLNAINNLSLTMSLTHFQLGTLCRFEGLFPGFGFVTLFQLLTGALILKSCQ